MKLPDCIWLRSTPGTVIENRTFYLLLTLQPRMLFEPRYSIDNLEGSVLLIPTVSVANVPQFCTDLLIHTLGFEKVVTLSDKYLYSFASPVDYIASRGPKEGVSLALECHLSKDKKITLLQQRSPILPGFVSQHVTEVLLPFIKSGKFSQVILIDLIDAAFSSQNFPGDIRRYKSDANLSESLHGLSLSDEKTEPLSAACAQSSYSTTLIQGLQNVSPLSYIAMYVYEGDNFYDAHCLAAEISRILQLNVTKWEVPVSWSGMYGDRPIPSAVEEGLYG